MSGRELVILLLGFAIIAVILRGLYVAIQARRGQIKLAIDKNIPRDVDLEALEMAELPGGGARVVTRSLEEVNRQNSALDSAQQKAEAIGLGEEDEEQQIPMLMDAVEVAERQGELPIDEPYEDDPVDEQQAWQENEVEQHVEESLSERGESFSGRVESISGQVESFSDQAQEHIQGADENESEEYTEPVQASYANQFDESPEDESADDVLLDYGDDNYEESQPQDNLSSVAPDYDDDYSEDDYADDEQHIEESYDSAIEDSADEDWQDEEEIEQDEPEYEEAQLRSANFEDQLGEFSMTAGERIGGHPSLGSEEEQSALFDDDEVESASETERGDSKSGFRSLFSAFGRKPKPASSDRAEKPDRKESPQQPVITEAEELASAFEAESVPESQVEESRTEEIQQEEYQDPEPLMQQSPDRAQAAPITRQTTQIEVRDELAEARAKPEEAEPVTETSEVLVINVMARDGRVFGGNDLLQVLITSGLKFGDMNIFHKRMSNDSNGPIIFSVANALNPGVFDLNNMEQFTTLGISLFLALPTPINNLDGFEQMLDTAQQIRGALDGELKDDHRNVMTAQTIEHYRQRVRDFELRRLKTAGARG